MKRTILLFFLFLITVNTLSATHSRSGEIIYQQVDATTIEASIITYTKASSTNADRDSLTICWGDGHCELLVRVNGPAGTSGVPNGEVLENDYKKNIYQGQHIYADFGNYLLSMSDPNRNGGIHNIVFSSGFPFFIETEVFLSEDLNSSPVLLQYPTDIAYTGIPFMHIPNAVDLDGDSIAYKMITPLQASGIPVTGYFELTDINPGSSNTLSFNEISGLLIWDAPSLVGEYTIAIEVTTYRDGVVNGRLIRDMLILVQEDENDRPVLDSDNITYNQLPVTVEVGDTIQFDCKRKWTLMSVRSSN